MENWQDENRLLLINSPSDQPTFYSRRWHTTSTPHIALCTEDLHGSIRREVGEQIGGGDHRPVFLKLSLGASTEATFPQWNYEASRTLFEPNQHSLRGHQVQGRDISVVVIELQLVHTQGCPGNHTNRSKKELQTVLESRATGTSGCTVRSQRSS